MNVGFKGLHPFSNFIYFVFTFMLSMASSNPFLLALCLLCGASYDIKLRGKKAFSYILKFILPLALLVTVFNSLFSHYGVTVLFVMKNGNNFTLEALCYGLVAAVRLSSMLLWLDCLGEILTAEKIIFLFGRFSPRLALIVSMVLRFIPLIRSQSEEILQAEKAIGNSANEKSFIQKIKKASRRLSILVSWTLEKGIDTSDSMRARGYGLKNRTSYNDYFFISADKIITLASSLAIVLSLVFSKRLEATYNPIISISPFDTVSVLICIFFTFVLCTPLIYDFKEEKTWSISK